MQIQTTRLGRLETLEVPVEAALTFPEGLPGFEDQTSFALIEDERYQPFGWLQSLADPAISFILIDPLLVEPSYDPDFGDQDLSLIDPSGDGELEAFCILVVREKLDRMTANLKAPVVVNRRAQLGKQVILTDERHSLRHPVFQPARLRAAAR